MQFLMKNGLAGQRLNLWVIVFGQLFLELSKIYISDSKLSRNEALDFDCLTIYLFLLSSSTRKTVDAWTFSQICDSQTNYCSAVFHKLC
jgi:hypothetical protein